MKLYKITVLTMLYTIGISADQQQAPQSIQITIDASTKSDLPQTQSLHQLAQQKSKQISSEQAPVLRRYHPDELQAVNGMAGSVTKKTLGFYAIGAMAGAANPWILPAYIVWRAGCYALADQPFIDTATTQEAEELALSGKKRVSEIVLFPMLYHLMKSSGK